MPGELEQLRRELQMIPSESGASFVKALADRASDLDDEEAAMLWLEELGRDAQFPKPVDRVMREARQAFAWKSSRE